jgi:DNA helicase-2/ATP-dependent DNA helicase PcrA
MNRKYTLTKEQREAISITKGPHLIMSVAGAGKTTTLTSKIIEVINRGLATPEQILALTFTIKASENMRIQIAEKVKRKIDPNNLQISTFHSFGNKIIKENTLILGLDTDFNLISRAESWQLLYQVMDNFVFKDVKIGSSIGNFLDKLLDFILDLKNHLINVEKFRKYVNSEPDFSNYESKALRKIAKRNFNVHKELLQVYEEYENIKMQQNFIDYGDQVMIPVQLFEQRPAILASYQNRYPYIFVDEYQDTNIAQAQLIYLLSSKEKNITVVGDDDQSIYGWRGASVYNILKFNKLKSFKREVKTTSITKSFRTGQNILDVAYNVVKENKNRLEKMPKAYFKKDSKIFTFFAPTYYDEVEFTAKEIERLINNNNFSYKDVAILCRKKRFDEITLYLDERDIPYEIVGGRGFYYRPEIIDAISLLKLTHDPTDSIALVRVLKSPRYKICDRDIFHLAKYIISRDKEYRREIEIKSENSVKKIDEFEMRINLIDAVLKADDIDELSKETKKRLNQLSKELSHFVFLSERLSLPHLLREMFEQMGLFSELISEKSRESERRKANLEKLIRIASDFERTKTEATFNSFMIYLREVLKAAELEPEELVPGIGNEVKVMSIHAAKGLEFPIVFIPMLCERDFPDLRISYSPYKVPSSLRGDVEYLPDMRSYTNKSKYRNALKEIALEEERRLFYVACTRAKDRLYLSYSPFSRETKKPKKISRFLQSALDKQLVEILGEDIREKLKVMENPMLQAEYKIKRKRKKWLEEKKDINLADFVEKDQSLDEIESKLKSKFPKITISERIKERALNKEKDIKNVITTGKKRIYRRKEKKFALHSPVFSYSALSIYKNCPKRYFWTYIQPLPTPNRLSIKIGNLIHQAIERSIIEKTALEKLDFPIGWGENLSWSEILSGEDLIYEEKIPKIKNMIKNYLLSRFSKTDENILAVEQLFNLKINKYIIRGFMDRIQKINNELYEIVDFKSGKKPTNLDLKENLQLKIYSLALSELYKISPENIKCTLFFLEDGIEKSIIYPKKVLLKTKKEIIRLIKSIEKSKFNTNPSPQNCVKCDFYSVCKDHYKK